MNRYGFYCDCGEHYVVTANSYRDAKELAICPSCEKQYDEPTLTRELKCTSCEHKFTAEAKVYSDFSDMKCPECESECVRDDLNNSGPGLLRQSLESLQTPEWFSERLDRMNHDLGTNAKPLK